MTKYVFSFNKVELK